MSSTSHHQPVRRGFLVYMAIGDAYGMAYEFADDMAAAGPNDLTYKSNLKYPAYQPGHYTDDTQMAWINAEILIQRDVNYLKPASFADAWVHNYQQDPRPGYSRYMAQSLRASADGADFISRIDASRGTTSGAVMRVAPIGLLPDAAEVLRVATLQARVTHDTPAGVFSAQAGALAVHALHHNLCPKAALPAWIDGQIGAGWRTLGAGDPESGLFIVRQAIRTVMACDTLSGVLRRCVDLGPGQDTDTIAAIAMAIASRSREIADDLPAHLLSGLENGPYGRQFLELVDAELLTRFPPVSPRQAPGPRPAP